MDRYQQIWNSLEDKEYRSLLAADVGTGLAFQIRLLREKRGLSQEELGQLAGKKQPTVSQQWENPDYGRFSLKTLKEIAAAFDVGLMVKFVSFGELVEWLVNITPERLAPPSYEEERQSALTGMSIRFGHGTGTTIDTPESVASYEGNLGTATSGYVPPGGGVSYEEQKTREREAAIA